VIAQSDVTAWSAIAPWATPDQVEQDLVLSRLMVEFAQHPVLGRELTMRGGTCLHKLWLPRPYRYSEDLDYVRTTAGGVGHLLDAVREVAEHVGFQDLRSRVGVHPKVLLRTTSSTGAALRVKVEMNTFERSPKRPTTVRRLEVASAWFAGTADVPTFALEELLATKIRALYQRAKGRDAFDLWLVARAFDVDPNDIAECFEPYWPHGWSPLRARANLAAKVRDGAYLEDLRPLVADWPEGFDAASAESAVARILDAIERRFG
jgi:predicted nucleotidyltransferase component of viral defense system